jgi:hypothetical protein
MEELYTVFGMIFDEDAKYYGENNNTHGWVFP